MKAKRFLKNSLKITTLGALSGYGYIYYNYPSIRNNPKQILIAIQRTTRIFNCSLKLIYNYKFANKDLSE